MVPRSVGKRVLPSQVVLKLKRNADGCIERRKARLVDLGCLQREDEYDQLFSPVVDFTSVRVNLVLAEYNQEHVYHLDIVSAYHYAILNETIYMSLPAGVKGSAKADGVYKLIKSIYGLRQSSRIFYEYLTAHLKMLDFTHVQHSECVFERYDAGVYARIVVYVDDTLSDDKVSEADGKDQEGIE